MNDERWQADEIQRCSQDPMYFFKTYLKIEHPTKGLIPFEPFKFQSKCIEMFLEHDYVIIKKPRQVGLSTLASSYALWTMLFHPNENIALMTHSHAAGVGLIGKCKDFIKDIPEWLIPGEVIKDTFRGLAFDYPSNSRINAITMKGNVGCCSENISLLIVDEAACISKFKELFENLRSSFTNDTKVIIISTQVEFDDYYYELWLEAEGGNNEFFPIDLSLPNMEKYVAALISSK